MLAALSSESILFEGVVEIDGGDGVRVEVLMDSGATRHNFMCMSLANRLDPLRLRRKQVEILVEMANSSKAMCSEAIDVSLTLSLPQPGGMDTVKTMKFMALIMDALTTDLVVGAKSLLDFNLFEPLKEHLRRVFGDGDGSTDVLATTISSRDIFPPEIITAESGLCDLEAYPDAYSFNPEDKPTIGGSPELQVKIKEMLKEFAPVFSNSVSSVPAAVTPMFLKRIGVDMPHAMRGRVRPQLPHHQVEIDKQIDQLLELGVIVPCNEDHFSQVLLVGKADNSKRLCIDFRHLNRVTEGLQWPLPIIPEIIRTIGGKSFYATLDLTSGYHQCALLDEASRLTAFKTARGMYRFTRVPFGLKGAPSYFQKAMADEVLKGLIPLMCAIYIDDCVIWGDTEEEFLSNLRVVLGRFRERGIFVKLKKCSFGVSEISYLGHVISKAGCTYSEARKEALMQLKTPETVTELRTFLGLAGYMRNHVKNFAELAAPLYELTKNTSRKTSPIAWSTASREAYTKLKNAVYQAEMVYHITGDGKITLFCDASDIACGAHLVQEINGVEQSIFFVSKTFSDTQRRWSVGDREMFAMYYGITQLKSFLGGRHFTLKTDHNNLRYWLTESASPKVQRWRIALSEFEFDIEYLKGELNVVADALSRLVIIAERTTEERDTIIAKFHGVVEGHTGVRKTTLKMKKAGICWPGLEQDVSKFIRSCAICQRNSMAPRTSHGPNFSLDRPGPNQLVAIDTMGPLLPDMFDFKYILVLVDAMSRYTVLYPLVNKDSKECARKLLDYVCCYGKPQQILSDNAGQFNADIISEFTKLINSEHHFTIAYSHQDNGQVERMIKEVRRRLEALTQEIGKPSEWSVYLTMVQRIINTTVNSSTGFAPATMKFGMDNALESDLFVQGGSTCPQEFVRSISEVQRNLAARYAQLCGEEEETDRHSTIFVPGEYVLVDLIRKTKQRVDEGRRSGPFKVLAQRGAAVDLFDPIANKARQVHVSRCRLYVTRNGEDPLLESVRNTDYYIVDKIVSHYFKPRNSRRPEHLHLQVLWAGYEIPESEFGSNSSLLKTAQFKQYASNYPELAKFIK
jgi:hypothetical protein